MTSISMYLDDFSNWEILSRVFENREKLVIKPNKQLKPTLPLSSELPDSDDIPVDNELQTLVPSLLHEILDEHWSGRTDWFFGINMGIYHTTGESPKIPIVPDAFLSLGVELWKKPYGRPSYIVWNENNTVPSLVLEFVSKTYRGEYDDKMIDYARLKVLYYVIYNPQYHKRHWHAPLEVYHLEKGKYMRKLGDHIWMPEIGLGIGRSQGIYKQRRREWLFWYDKNGNRFPTPTEKTIAEWRQRQQAELETMAERRQKEQAQRQALLAEQRAEQERQQAEQERQRAEQLAKLLREMGVDPNKLG